MLFRGRFYGFRITVLQYPYMGLPALELPEAVGPGLHAHSLGLGAWGSRFFQHLVLTPLYLALQCNSPSSMLRARGIVTKLFSR